MTPKEKQPWWQFSVADVIQKLQTNQKQGLRTNQVKQRLVHYGRNVLPKQKKLSPFMLFLSQFSSFIVWVLIGASLITGLLGEWIDSIAIGAIVFLNAIIGFIQEYSAERSLEALKKLTKPTSRVIREGKLHKVSSDYIVPGDLVVLEAGDLVPADGRIINEIQLTTQEAALTGESMPILKQVEKLTEKELSIADQSNMVFMGTIVVKGKGQIIVTNTALHTELGSIASLLQAEKRKKTPLQIQLEQLGRRLVIICFGIVAIIFSLGLWRGSSFISMILTALSLAVAAIPEGLPAVMTIALAIGMRKMAKRKVLIRRLPSVETLGRTTVICSDKTGTLTQNQMTVRSIWTNKKVITVTGVGYEPKGSFEFNDKIINPTEFPELMLALKIGILCNSAHLEQKNNSWYIIGDPTEGALLTVAGKAGFEKKDLEIETPLIKEIPFDSERQRMSMVRNESNERFVFVKGSPEVILNLSKYILIDGNNVLLTNEHKAEIKTSNKKLASQALRVLALAYRKINPNETIDETVENNLIFVGLSGMMDPPRLQVKEAIAKCKTAGIKTVMITGDQKETAFAIASELGLANNYSQVITGAEIERMNESTLKTRVQKLTVYARVSPEHKLRIVQAFKSRGEIVAMTGDGVNDAPSIKAADIGIAMGITGTEVAKEASDMIILDDNFATIVNAVEEGRCIYDNIVKFINYLLSSNIAELMIIFIGTFFGFLDPEGNPYISLLPIQLLWINLVTDGFPAIALGVDPVDPHIMTHPPKKASDPILSFYFVLKLFSIAFVIAVGAIAACHYGLRTSARLGHTMTFSTLVTLELVRVHMVRSQYHIRFFSNPWLIIALIISFALQLVVIYTPQLQTIFRTTFLGVVEWGVILIVVIIVWAVSRLIQAIFNKITPNTTLKR